MGYTENAKEEFDASAMGNFIILLAFTQKIAANAAFPLSSIQPAVEILLSVFIIFSLFDKKLAKQEILTGLIFLIVTLISFLTDYSWGLIAATKENFLAVLALMFFSRFHFDRKIVLLALVLTISTVVPSYFFVDVAKLLSPLAADSEYNASRFGGIFFEAHFNAFFMAAVLLYYRRKFSLLFIDVFFVYVTGSKFVFAAYVLSILWIEAMRRTRYGLRLLVNMFITFALILCLVMSTIFFEDTLHLLLFMNQRSFAVIFSQLFDINYYVYLINIIPKLHYYVSGSSSAFAFHSGHNEIGFFSLTLQSGIVLGTAFLIAILARSPWYGVLILVSLLHNQFILSPLMIGIFFQFGRELLGTTHPTKSERHILHGR